MQAVFVPSTFSGEPRDFYMGVVHAESNRAYENYFYKMQVGGNQLPCCCNNNDRYGPAELIHP
jgi:hypothetical protein